MHHEGPHRKHADVNCVRRTQSRGCHGSYL